MSNIIELSLIVCVYNEEENIVPFLDAVVPILRDCTSSFEIIFIDDGSVDSTIKQILNYPAIDEEIKIVKFSRNFGKEIALTAGLDYARGSAIVPIDVDLQLPVDLIPIFIHEWKKGYKNVVGIRIDRDYEPPFKRLVTNYFYRILGLVSSVKIIPNAGDYRLLDRQVVDEIKKMRENSRFMKGIFAYPGFSSVSVPYKISPRQRGATKWNFWKLFNFSLDGIFGFSNLPLRFLSLLGLIICLISFLYAIFTVALALNKGVDTPGYVTTIIFILFFGGCQLVSVGVLGEYIARIFAEVKNRPLYIVSEEIVK